MASHALQPPIAARVDRAGRLIAADPPVLALQEQAGARIDAPLAIPQLAAVARLAARLGVAIERPVLADPKTRISTCGSAPSPMRTGSR